MPQLPLLALQRRTIPTLSCLLLLALASPGCDKPAADKPAADKPAGGGATPAGRAERKVHKLTPEAYVAEYGSNLGEAARRKYGDGLVELTGTVARVGVNFAGDPVVDLLAGPPGPGGTQPPAVNCYTTAPEPWATLARGQAVTLRGRMHHMPNANLDQCAILDPGPSTAVAATAPELATAYAGDRAAFNAAHAQKDLVVTGTVVERKDADTGVTLYLTGTDAVRVRCSFSGIDSIAAAVAPVKVGQRVKLTAEMYPANQTDTEVILTGCKLITGK